MALFIFCGVVCVHVNTICVCEACVHVTAPWSDAACIRMTLSLSVALTWNTLTADVCVHAGERGGGGASGETQACL